MNRGLPAVQAMISRLGDEFQFHCVLDDHERLEKVLFFHNACLQLLRLFPKSYVLDATLKELIRRNALTAGRLSELHRKHQDRVTQNRIAY